MKKILFAVCLCAMMMFVAVPAVQAVSVVPDAVYYFTSDHSTDGLGTAPWGEVDLFTSGVNVNFHVVLYDSNKFINTGAGGGFNFMFDATGVVLGDISGTGLTVGVPGHADGTGDWQFGVVFTGQGTGGANALPGPIDFTVINATIAEVAIGNGGSDNESFIADIISGSTGYTGLTDAGGQNQVPEPTTMLLLGLGLVGLAGVRRFKK